MLNCPKCGQLMKTAVMDGRPAWCCYPCEQVMFRQTTGLMDVPAGGVAQMPRGEAVTAVRGSRGSRRAHPESALVADIVKALRACGRTVLRCGQWRSDYAGSDAGVPDILVWTGCGWTGLEAKTATGRLSPAQRKLAAAGQVRVVRSVDEALSIVEEEGRNL